MASGSAKKLPPNGKSLNICVNGQQYVWRYTYQADCAKNDFRAPFAYEKMVVPVDTTVTLDITGQDVIHSWWIPEAGRQVRRRPRLRQPHWFKIPASKAGQTFRGQCAELCGRNHADMVADVQAVTPTQFEAWLVPPEAGHRRRRRRGTAAAQAVRGNQQRPTRLQVTPEPALAATADTVTAPVRPVPQIAAREVRPEPTGWVSWVTTTDHKRIGIMYMVTTFVFFLMGGTEALMMRLQLGAPNNTLVTPQTYNALFTMHGTTMIFLFVVPMMAGFGNYFVPADDRRAGHGVPEAERPVVLAAGRRRRRLLRRRCSSAPRRPAGPPTRRCRRSPTPRTAASTHGSS